MAPVLARRADDVGYDDFTQTGMPERRHNGGRQRGAPPSAGNNEQLARALGWFSIGLGMAEVVAPGRLAELIGVESKPGAFRLMGLREIGSGIAILGQEQPAGGVWSRVAGDILDLALLSTHLGSRNPERQKTLAATVSVLGVTALDIFVARSLSRESNGDSQRATSFPTRRRTDSARGINVKRTVTVNRPVAEVYSFWRNFENLPRFMTHLESVRALEDGRRTHWVALGPLGKRLEWDAELVEDQPNQLISWRSLPGGSVATAGSVRFRPAPANRGTEIVVEMSYDPPGGVVGATIAKLFGESGDQVVARDLQAFKNVLEVGEVVHSDSSIYQRPHAARPPEERELEKARLITVGDRSAEQ